MTDFQILHLDGRFAVCIKPPGVVSTDEPGGMPELLRHALGEANGCVRTVHRLDQVVSGLMVLARSRKAASILSEQIRQGVFEKTYLAVVHGAPSPARGALRDLLYRDKAIRKTLVVAALGKEVQEAVLEYEVLATCDGLSLVRIQLRTGRTHQIRAQFSGRGWPLVGDGKYGAPNPATHIALWSAALAFHHPQTGQPLRFEASPPRAFPWDLFLPEKT